MNKTVWITGASTGIGKQLALCYARNGDTVYASARSTDKLDALVQEGQKTSGQILAAPLDVTDSQAINVFLEQLGESGSIPDVCVFNAGFYNPIGLNALTVENFETTLNVNYMGVIRGLVAVIPKMIKQRSSQSRRGHIAIVASVAGYSGLPRAAAYGSSKAALINLAESIKAECEDQGISVTLINPGFVKTPMTDLNSFTMPFLMTPEDAAARMFRGLEARRFEISFPRRFTWLLKFLRILPYPLYFFITKRIK